MLRGLAAMSDEERAGWVSALERGSPCGMLDLRTMTDAELDQCIAELERLIADAAATERAAPGSKAGQCPIRPALT
jgi:hypothetical protein